MTMVTWVTRGARVPTATPGRRVSMCNGSCNEISSGTCEGTNGGGCNGRCNDLKETRGRGSS